jgi:SH3-like domain-containing protein
MQRMSIKAILSCFLASGLLLPGYSAGAAGQQVAVIPPGAVSCSGSVYTVDPDPKGTNVRSSPRGNAPVVIVIPDDSESTVVDLSASFEDWLLIHAARGVTSGFSFQGEGWVHGSLLAVRAMHPSGWNIPLYSKPDAKSSVIKTIAGDTEVKLTGCKGDWMHVGIGALKGWLAPEDYCGNPVTTCVSVPDEKEHTDSEASSILCKTK